MVFVCFNLAVGVGLWLAVDQSRITSSYFLINQLLTYRIWGIMFAALGIWQAWSLFRDSRRMMSASHMAGVITKSLWAFMLIIRSFTSSGAILVACAMVALAAIQFLYFVYLPRRKPSEGALESADE